MVEALEVVAAVATRADGRILVCRRALGRASAGQWEFPGGKVETGEPPADALRRELREELGVEATIGELLTRDITMVGSLPIDLACYRVSFDSGPPRESSDHDVLRWLEVADLPTVTWALPDLPAVDFLLKGQTRP